MALHRPLFLAALVAALLGAAAPVGLCQNRINERDEFRNTAFVETGDDEMRRSLLLADEAAESGDLHAAVAHLAQVMRRGGGALIPFGDRTYLPGPAAAQRRLAALPPEAVDIYLAAVAEEARRAAAKAAAARDEARLFGVATSTPFTAESFAALKTLGDLASERGEHLVAATRYRRYLDQAEYLRRGAPDPQERRAVQALLYLSLLRCGRPDEAAPYLPAGPVEVRGEALSPERLATLVAAEPPAAGEDAAAGWPTRGGGRSRGTLPGFDCRSLKLLWERGLEDDAGEEPELSPPFRSLSEQRFLAGRRLRSSVYPVVRGGTIYVFNDEELHALELETGEAVFGPLAWDWSLLFGDNAPRLENVTYSGTIAGDVLYLTLNEQGRGSYYADHSGAILALSLAREGACLWMHAPREAPRREDAAAAEDPLAGTAFTGAPVVAAGRVFVMGTRHTTTTAEARIFCFDAATGALLFERFLCSGAEPDKFGTRSDLVNPAARHRVELGAPIVEHEGRLYCLTNLGVAAALDAFTGEILWLFKYNRLFPQDPDTYERAYFIDTGGWEDSLPLFKDGRLIFAPSDSRFLYTLAPEPDAEGYIVLDDPIEKGRYASLIGTDGETFYFTAREGGRHYIAAAARSGALLWETVFFEKEDRIAGDPLLTRSAIFVPTLRYLYRVDLAAKGLITHSFSAPAEGGKHQDLRRPVFGNIIATGDRLISVSDTKVLVFAP